MVNFIVSELYLNFLLKSWLGLEEAGGRRKAGKRNLNTKVILGIQLLAFHSSSNPLPTWRSQGPQKLVPLQTTRLLDTHLSYPLWNLLKTQRVLLSWSLLTQVYLLICHSHRRLELNSWLLRNWSIFKIIKVVQQLKMKWKDCLSCVLFRYKGRLEVQLMFNHFLSVLYILNIKSSW